MEILKLGLLTFGMNTFFVLVVCSENFRMVCSISGYYQLDSSISTLHPIQSCDNKSLHIHCKCLLRVKINLYREPLIESFTEANWTLRLDKYKINFFFTICWMARCPLVNHDIYEKVWLQPGIFH